MTTSVTINAHAGWAVEVTPISKEGKKGITTTVEPMTKEVFSIWDGRDLLIHEVTQTELARDLLTRDGY